MSLPHRFRYVSRAALVLCAGASLLGLPTAHATFNLATIHTFDDAADGNVTYPALVQGADGKFYGVNSTGGRSDNGTVFSLNANGGAFATLNTFTGSNQGKTPEGGLVQARDGNFYGTTSTGGNDGFGTLYQVVPTTGKLTALASFTNGDPGGNPGGTLIEGLDGFLYGTAEYGGIDNDGTVFRAAITGGADTLATITGGLAGVYPQSDLIQAADGNFYGTTSQGGTASLGTFFQVTPGGALNVLYSFTGGADGSRPLRGVVQGTDGAFYGVCNQGGTYGNGAIYRVAVSGVTATVTGLYSFLPLLGDGSNALGNLLLASDGNLYGTSAGGGAYGDGTIFEVTETGGFNVLYSFANGADGGFPVAGLTQGSDGRLYGTTAGQNGSAGTVFVVNAGLASPAPAPVFLLSGNGGVITSASVGDTILIKGDHFVGTTGVSFAGANNAAVAATSFTVLSKTVLQAVVPDGAQTGVITVTANGRSAATPGTLGVATVTAPVVLPTVAVLANVPMADKAAGTVGKFKITRTGGDNTAALTVGFKVAPASTAMLGTDYTLIAKGAALGTSGTVTIPAGKASIGVKVVPVQSTTPAPATTVFLKVKKSDAYTLGSPVRAVVQITANGAGQ